MFEQKCIEEKCLSGKLWERTSEPSGPSYLSHQGQNLFLLWGVLVNVRCVKVT